MAKRIEVKSGIVRRSSAQGQALVERWRASGESVTAFFPHAGVGAQVLRCAIGSVGRERVGRRQSERILCRHGIAEVAANRGGWSGERDDRGVRLPRFGGHPDRGYSPRRSANAEKKFTPRIIQEGRRTPTDRARFENRHRDRQGVGRQPQHAPSLARRFEPQLTGGAQPSQGEREEIERLRSELRDLKAENSLLKKAAALVCHEHASES